MDERRTSVSEAVREELAEIIASNWTTPAAGGRRAQVEVSPDARYAHIKVVVRGDDREQDQSMAALEPRTSLFASRTGCAPEPAARSGAAFRA